MNKYIIIIVLALITSCATYEEGITTFNVAIKVSSSENLTDEIEITLTDSKGTHFTALTDHTNTAHFNIPCGIYQAQASKVVDGEYIRTLYNGNINDMIVEGNSEKTMNIVTSVVTLRNPLIIKEVYCGGCQKDDGSGTFVKDKCIILYNNSEAAMKLDNVAIGMVEPYNAEASSHLFLNDGKLDYAEETWIPAINGIWYFQDGEQIEPYSELVVNVCGAIDNTPTYRNSINYANSSYYCMYDPSYTSSDGKSYDNTSYYPVPSVEIPTNHYLLTVKYGQANAWPMSQLSPALLLFKTTEQTPRQYAENDQNIIYPTGKNGNMVYACLKVERKWVLDAVEIYNANSLPNSKKRLTADLDNGYVSFINGYGHSVMRKVEKYVNGHPVYQDTNNSSNDFYETDKCSIQ